MIEGIVSIPVRVRGLQLVGPNTPMLIVTSPVPVGPTPDELATLELQRINVAEKVRIEHLVADFSAATNSFLESLRQQRAELQHVAVELAIAVAARLLHDRIGTGDFAVERMVRTCLDRLGSVDAVQVRLHPDDIALLEDRLGGRRPLFADTGSIQLVPTTSLGRGSCRCDSGLVSVSSSLESQLLEMRGQLLRSLPHA